MHERSHRVRDLRVWLAGILWLGLVCPLALAQTAPQGKDTDLHTKYNAALREIERLQSALAALTQRTTAQETARTWTHVPETADGTPVTRWAEMHLTFQLDKGAEADEQKP